MQQPLGHSAEFTLLTDHPRGTHAILGGPPRSDAQSVWMSVFHSDHRTSTQAQFPGAEIQPTNSKSNNSEK